MTKEINKDIEAVLPSCYSTNAIEKYKDEILATVVLHPQDYPDSTAFLENEDLIAGLAHKIHTTTGLDRDDFRDELSRQLEADYGISYNVRNNSTQKEDIAIELCLAEAILENPEELFPALRKEQEATTSQAPTPQDNETPIIIAAHQADPAYKSETGTACEAVIEALETNVVQDPMDKKMETPSQTLPHKVQCEVTTSLPSK